MFGIFEDLIDTAVSVTKIVTAPIEAVTKEVSGFTREVAKEVQDSLGIKK